MAKISKIIKTKKKKLVICYFPLSYIRNDAEIGGQYAYA